MLPETSWSLVSSLMHSSRRDGAWKKLNDLYWVGIYRWCRARTNTDQDAQDLAQEVQLKLFKAFRDKKFEKKQARFRTFLCQVVQNAITDFCRKVRSRPDYLGTGGDPHQEALSRLEDPTTVEALVEFVEDETGTTLTKLFPVVQRRVKPENWQAFEEIRLKDRRPVEVANEYGRTIQDICEAVKRIECMLKVEFLKMQAEEQEP